MTAVLRFLASALAFLLLIIGMATISQAALDACAIKVFGFHLGACPQPPRLQSPRERQSPSDRLTGENALLSRELRRLEIRLASLKSCPAIPPPSPAVSKPEPRPDPPVEEIVRPAPPPPNRCEPQQLRPDQQLAVILDASTSMELPYELSPAERRLIREFEVSVASRGRERRASDAARRLYRRLLGDTGRYSRLEAAKRDIIKSVSRLGDRQIDYLVMNGCRETTSRALPASNIARVVNPTRTRQGTGGTDLLTPVREAADKMLPGPDGRYTGVILLVTDGMHNCPGDACEAANQLARRKPGLTINVIDVAGHSEVACLAQGGGQVWRAGAGADLADLIAQAQHTIDTRSCPDQGAQR